MKTMLCRLFGHRWLFTGWQSYDGWVCHRERCTRCRLQRRVRIMPLPKPSNPDEPNPALIAMVE